MYKLVTSMDTRIVSQVAYLCSLQEVDKVSDILNILEDGILSVGPSQPCYKPQKSGQRFKHSHHE